MEIPVFNANSIDLIVESDLGINCLRMPLYGKPDINGQINPGLQIYFQCHMLRTTI